MSLKLFLLNAVSVFLLSPLAFSASSNLSIRIVTDLNRNEPYQAHLFHEGLLWVGQTKITDDSFHRMEVYSASGTERLAIVRLPHTPGFVYPFGRNRVLVIGKSSWPWKTHYTTITHNGGEFRADTRTFNEGIQVEQFAGTPEELFFTEVGEGAIYNLGWHGAGFLPARVSGPGKMQIVGNSLFVIERRGFELGDENLVKIDLKTQEADRTFKDHLRQGLVDILALNDGKQLAGAEGMADQVLLIDVNTNTLTKTIPAPGFPRALTQMGRCLIVSSDESRVVRFFDVSVALPKLIDEWDLSVVGNKLRKANAVSADPSTGRVYVRSTYICPTCDDTMSSVVVAEQTSGDTLRACTR